MKNLQVIDTKEIAVIDYNIEEVLAEFKKKHTVLAVSNNKERDIVQKGITELTTLRTNVEKRRKVLKADALEFGRKVDAEAARVTGLIEAVEQPLKDVKQAYDDEKERIRLEVAAKEQARIDAIMAQIESIRNRATNMIGKSSEEIGECHLTLTDELIVGDGFDYQEFAQQARKVQSETMERLVFMNIERQKFESEQIAQELREKEAEAARIKLEAEQAALRAEQKAFEDKQAAARQEEESRIAAVQKVERDTEHMRRQEELKRQQEENIRLAKINEDELAIERQKLQLQKEKAEHEAKMVRDAAEQEAAKQSLIVKAAPAMLDALEQIIELAQGDSPEESIKDIKFIAVATVNKAKAV